MTTLLLAPKKSIRYATLAVTVLLNGYTCPVIASGFALMEQSGTGLGTAYANTATGGEDISAMFYNPASLTRYRGTEFISTYYLIISDTTVNLSRSTDILNNPIRGSDKTNSKQSAHIPNVYFATDLTEQLRLGLGLTVPFGLSIDYGTAWQGRYELTHAELYTADINPVLAYLVNDKLSIGLGFSAQHIQLEMNQVLDFGSICLSQLGLPTCSSLGLLPQSADGSVNLEIEGWSWGYNFGVLYHPSKTVQLGLAYRSDVNHKLDGTGHIDVPLQATPLTTTGAFQDSNANATVTMPAHLSLGLAYQATDQLKALLSLTWTEWSDIKALGVNYENSAQPTTLINLNFQNTIKVSLGFILQLNNHWSIQSGFSFDQTPVKNANNRTFYVPDSNRYWASFGINYQAHQEILLNLAYAHVFFDDAHITRQTTRAHMIEGELNTQVDIISAQIRLAF